MPQHGKVSMSGYTHRGRESLTKKFEAEKGKEMSFLKLPEGMHPS